jgi:hypothetical protein
MSCELKSLVAFTESQNRAIPTPGLQADEYNDRHTTILGQEGFQKRQNYIF